MKWLIKDSISTRAGFISMLATFVLFALGTAVGIVVYPFANYYLVNNALPDSDTTNNMFTSLKDNATAIFLSCIIGGVLAMISIFTLRFGRAIGTFITLLEQIVIYSGLYYFAIWIIYRVNSVPSNTIVIMVPYFVYQLAAVITLEIAAILGQSGRIGYNHACLGAILGSMIGILRSVDLNYFPTSEGVVFNETTGIAFARSAVDTTFFFGACFLASTCIARSKIGGSVFWHLLGLVLSIGLACAYATTSEIADSLVTIMSSSTARWVVACLVSAITCLIALAVFWPMHKQAKALAVPPNTHHPQRQQAVTGRIVNGPIAANAVMLV